MPCNNIPLRDRQYYSYYEDPVGSGIWKQYVSSSGTFTQTGLHIAQRITTMIVTDVAAPIPAVALAQRNELVIHNKSTETVYIGNSNVTGDAVVGTTSGFEISPNAFQNISITDAITMYAVTESGKTALIKVWEVA